MRVKLFHSRIDYDPKASERSLQDMEDKMNNFLKMLDDSRVKKIYVAIDSVERMGLIEYKED